MAEYKIAWLPGDGVGGEVLDAAKRVLDRVSLDAEYIPSVGSFGNPRETRFHSGRSIF